MKLRSSPTSNASFIENWSWPNLILNSSIYSITYYLIKPPWVFKLGPLPGIKPGFSYMQSRFFIISSDSCLNCLSSFLI